MGTVGEHIRILHTNDLHGSLDAKRVERLAALRSQADCYFDTGDCIKTGNLGVPLRPEPVWPLLASLNCSASVPGNRESHLLKSTFEAKIAGHAHPILCANLFDRSGNLILPESMVLSVGEVKVGVFGVMVPMVTERMKSKSLSQFLWTSPIEAALRVSEELRSHCDLLIALTHLGIRQDQALAEADGRIDLILGGHSHTVLTEPLQIGPTWICQGGSHGRYIGRYTWKMGRGLIESELLPWLP